MVLNGSVENEQHAGMVSTDIAMDCAMEIPVRTMDYIFEAKPRHSSTTQEQRISRFTNQP